MAKKHGVRWVRAMCNTCWKGRTSWEGVPVLVLGAACTGKGAEETLFKSHCAIDDDR